MLSSLWHISRGHGLIFNLFLVDLVPNVPCLMISDNFSSQVNLVLWIESTNDASAFWNFLLFYKYTICLIFFCKLRISRVSWHRAKFLYTHTTRLDSVVWKGLKSRALQQHGSFMCLQSAKRETSSFVPRLFCSFEGNLFTDFLISWDPLYRGLSISWCTLRVPVNC